MSRLTDLLRQVGAKDEQLAADLMAEFKVLSGRRAFGLNFERHQPEAVELPRRTVRKGDKVRVLPPRGSKERGDQRLWRVTSLQRKPGHAIAQLSLLYSTNPETNSASVEDLVVVAEFRDPIYPGLRSTGTVQNGGEKPFHTVINAENFHALQTLLYTHRGTVDCIYIDPPYNTGAKDWKYNNDYVDGEDAYRHSKWLAFMERRLRLAKELLNPDDSALIVTIDEKEYLRLGLLLEQTFPEARIQMISIIINRSGTPRTGQFSRVEEYAFFVFMGAAGPTRFHDDMLSVESSPSETTIATPVRWDGLMRTGTNANREDREKSFFPIFVNKDSGTVHSIGEYLPLGQERSSVVPPSGTEAHWPIRSDGSEGRWQMTPDKLANALQNGFARVGSRKNEFGMLSFSYLKAGQLKKIRDGEIEVLGFEPNGAAIVAHVGERKRVEVPRTVWNRQSHSAADHGSSLLRRFVPRRSFPFPKSLYAVEDTLRFVVGDKPDALIIDFFSGSGTTAHAVMRLNRHDGGRRRSICVTNNEVSADESEALRGRGFRPGDPEWEEHGICDFITKPRIQAAITGRTPAGTPVTGEYKFNDVFPMAEGFEENVEFFDLTYETSLRVSHNRAFQAIAPLLWLKAGGEGRRIDSIENGWSVADTYGVIADLDQAPEFLDKALATETLRMVFIVTNDVRRFQMLSAELPSTIRPVRLYESYLNNFEINTGRE